jgi:hypothetical protein
LQSKTAAQNVGAYKARDAGPHRNVDQIAHIAITQFISDIPSHGLMDKKMVEMADFEERGLLRRGSGHEILLAN